MIDESQEHLIGKDDFNQDMKCLNANKSIEEDLPKKGF